MSEQKPITWLTARQLADDPSWPFRYSQAYDLANKFAIPHWRPGGAEKAGIRFPLEVIKAWMQGEPVGDHWLMGRLATDLPPSDEAVQAVQGGKTQANNATQ